ncbi:MAG: serine/threonine protein kinase [Lachnospiraceae bacterium]|nr:serine/threonine protein kinase [Lachnospiraceae bacterium]MBP3577633.1 serine/threonine protein kinase [Lachnospiraceae bacterium]
MITTMRGTRRGINMDYMNYKTIQVMKKSERAEILFATVDGMEKPVVIKRLAEANPEIYREVAEIESPHIPKIYCVEKQENVLVVAEEFIDGCTLNTYLEKEHLTDIQKLELMLQLCNALEILHKCIPPVIHRDIKPTNILITPDGVLKVIDFDAARQYKTEKNTSDTRLLGTIEYAAPEQFGYSQTDFRSDIYSVGVVFSEIIIGKGASFAKGWKHLVDKCTSFDPANRYKNVAELKKDLLKCIRRGKNRKKYAGLVASSVVILLLIGIGLLLNGNKETEEVNEVPTVAAEPSPASTVEDTSQTIPTSAPEQELLIKNIQGPLPEMKAKHVMGARTEAEGYIISRMEYVESEEVSYKINDNGAALLQFEKNYGRIVFELPVIVDMEYCVDVMTRIDTRVGDVTMILYDENGIAVESFDINKAQDVEEVYFSTSCEGKVAYVGFMANDEELEDFSDFATIVYYVDFLVINPDTPKISYTMADLTEEDYYYCDYTRNEDGSVTIEYEQLHGKLKLRLPAAVDMRYCVGIGIVMKSEEGLLEVNSYNKEFEFVESFQGYRTNGIEEKLLRSYSGVAVEGIGLRLDGPETKDYSGCTATVYAINFYMEDDYQEKMSQVSNAVSSEMTGNEGHQKKVVGKQTEPAEYFIGDFSYVDSNNLSYHLNDDGSVSLQFTKIYDSILYELPELIDMSCCEKFAVKMDVHKGEVAVVLHDETGMSVESFYHPYGTVEEEGMRFSWDPKFTGKAGFISVLANDGELEDYSDFDTTLYTVTFYMQE